MHSQQGLHPATAYQGAPMHSAAASGYAGHMGPGGSMSSSSHAGAPSWMQPGQQGAGGAMAAAPHAGTPSWMQPGQQGGGGATAASQQAGPPGWTQAGQPGVHIHPHGATLPAGHRYLNDGTGRIEKIPTGANC